MKVKAKIVKQVFAKDTFRIFGCVPLQEYKDLQVNDYGSFTITGDLPYLDEGNEYTLELDKGQSNKYGTQYKVLSVPSIEDMEFTDANEYEYLCNITTPSQAGYVNKAYPNFIRLIINGDEDKIDIKNIYNVKEVRFAFLKREINEKYKYFKMVTDLKDYEITMAECQVLGSEYKTIENTIEQTKANPYYTLIQLLKRNFMATDKLLMTIHPELRQSEIRTEFLILHTLQQNEYDGNSRIHARDMAKKTIEIAPECVSLLKVVAVASELIYYDEPTNDMAIMATYLAECEIAQFVKEKISRKHELDWDWKKYQTVGDFSLTDTQMGLLENFCKHSISLLVGNSGCVDCDTEYFNGNEWKKISEYTEGENVLQYHQNGNASLIKPQQYHKYLCDNMWHFETMYGIDQTLSDEHRIVYKTPKGIFKECSMLEMKEKHESGNFYGKFLTTFSYNGAGIDLTDEEIKLMCAVICDGSFYSFNENKPDIGSYNTCRFHVKKERKKDELRTIFKNANLEYKETQSATEGYTDLYVKAPRREKEFTSYWYGCSQRQLQIICDNVMFWDGSINYTKIGNKKRMRFSTTIKQTADFIQFAFSSCNMRSTISINDRRGRVKLNSNGRQYITKSIEYNVVVGNYNTCSLNRTDEKTPITKYNTKDGYKYCFTVDTGMLVLRRHNKIFITGNSGKSSCTVALVNMLEDNGLTYKLLCPTGKASKRLAECTDRETSTIHRLCFSSGEEGIWADVIIVDEFSMVDINVMSMLIRSIQNPKCRIVFVGDDSQLSSIGTGNVFFDLINSNILPITKLTEIFRYKDNGSLFVATNVRQGIEYLSNEPTQKFGKNFTFIQSNDCFSDLVSAYMGLIDKGISPNDILCLSPYNIGSEGTYHINNVIQSKINPPIPNEKTMSYTKSGVDIIFRVGSRVINKKNDYSATLYDYWEQAKAEGVSIEDCPKGVVFNGDEGVVTLIDDEKMVVKFDNDFIVFTRDRIYNLLLSYAVSVHSSQGSESEYVINISSSTHKRMLNRNLIYVANTRSKGKHIEIGDIKTINDALKIAEQHERNTFLQTILTT